VTRLLPLLLLQFHAVYATAEPPTISCGTTAGGAREAILRHAYQARLGRSASVAEAAADRDEGHVAILEDRGDLVSRRNPFDLDGASLRFSPNRQGGYDVVRLSLALEPPGPPVGLGDDEVQAIDLPFAFPFYGKSYERAYLHSDGQLTFRTPDRVVGERGVARFLSGPPRVAPLFTDLDPSRGGTISVQLAADRALFAWTDVPGGGQVNRNTFAVALHPDGAIDFVYGTALQTREAVVGLSPGIGDAAMAFSVADLSRASPTGTTDALLERFSETEELDLVSVVRRFLAGRADRYEQLVIYTTRPLNPVAGTLAFELNVKNDIHGIGVDVRDDSAQWGSAGALASVVYMDSIDPYLEVDGFEILGHEVAHRWLSRLRFRDHTGSPSRALLGRGEVHWSFFMDTDASVMEGSDLADRGGGRFETADIARGYSALDLYAMGLRAASEVPPFFYVEDPDDFRPNRGYKATSGPEAGVSFTGVRRDVTIEDVIAAMGPRAPDASLAPRVLKQAFVLVADRVAPATEPRVRGASRIRARFADYYREATRGRGEVETTLP
jgi:hypothetical protein